MHSGFDALRSECPADLLGRIENFKASDAVMADIGRLETLWATARKAYGQNGPWLFGDYSLADVFYAPTAGRIATDSLPVSKTAQAYVDAHLAHVPFRQWRAMGMTKTYEPAPYFPNAPRSTWPAPHPIAAKAVATGP